MDIRQPTFSDARPTGRCGGALRGHAQAFSFDHISFGVEPDAIRVDGRSFAKRHMSIELEQP